MNALYDAYYTCWILSTFCDVGYKAVATDDSISVQRCLMLQFVFITIYLVFNWKKSIDDCWCNLECVIKIGKISLPNFRLESISIMFYCYWQSTNHDNNWIHSWHCFVILVMDCFCCDCSHDHQMVFVICKKWGSWSISWGPGNQTPLVLGKSWQYIWRRSFRCLLHETLYGMIIVLCFISLLRITAIYFKLLIA